MWQPPLDNFAIRRDQRCCTGRTDPSIGEGVTAHTKLCEIMEAMALALASGLGSATVLARLLDTHEPLVLRAIDRATGNTALHAAVLAANVEAVQLLCVRAPSLCAVRNFSGLTARDLAFAEDFGLHYHRCTTTVAKASWVDQPSSSAGTISRALAAAASYKMIREMLKRASMPRSDSASSLAATDTEEEGEPQSIELCSLPEEMQMCIFRQLGSASDLCRLRLCCRRLRGSLLRRRRRRRLRRGRWSRRWLLLLAAAILGGERHGHYRRRGDWRGEAPVEQRRAEHERRRSAPLGGCELLWQRCAAQLEAVAEVVSDILVT